MRRCALGCSRAHTRARATASPSPRTSAPRDVFDRAVADFADAYAEQNQRDYDALREAVDAGRVAPQAGI